MDAGDLLSALAEMPPEEQRAVLSGILFDGGEAGWCSEAMRRQLQALMREMEASEDPTTMYREMARMCLERVSTADEPASLTPPREWTRTWVIPEAW